MTDLLRMDYMNNFPQPFLFGFVVIKFFGLLMILKLEQV